MPWSITIGTIAGTAIRIHLTFLLFLVWIGVGQAMSGGAAAGWSAVLFVSLLFGCVVLHEFGHILAARRSTPTISQSSRNPGRSASLRDSSSRTCSWRRST
jgi:Zn-dependent protease